MSSPGKTVFLRDATGLRKDFGLMDAMWINLSLTGVIFSTYFMTSTAPLVGGNPSIGVILPIVGMFFVALTFASIGLIAPRTASDYIFISRELNPAIGFVGNAGYFVSTVPFFMGITAVVLQSFALAPFLLEVGVATGNSGLISLVGTVQQPAYIILIGGIETTAMGLLPILGNRAYRLFQRIVIPLVLIAIVIMLGVLASTTPSLAASRVNSFVTQNGFSNNTNYYQSIVSSPAAFVPDYNSPLNSLALNAVLVVGLSYIISSIYIAGEVKTIKRTMPFSILGALLITAVIFYLSIVLEYHALGYPFTASLFSLALSGNSQYVIPVIPYLNIIVGIISGSPILGAVLSLITLVQMLSYQASAAFVGGRLLLAYSFDRIIPRALGDVSDRFHVPAKAIVASLVIGLIGIVTFALIPIGIAFLFSSLAIAILIVFPILVAGVAVIRYRIVKKQEFKAGPLAGIWLGKLLVVSGAVTVLYSAFTLYQYVTIPALGVSAPFPITAAELGLGSIIILFAIFFVAKYWNQSKGVPFDVIFKELPPE